MSSVAQTSAPAAAGRRARRIITRVLLAIAALALVLYLALSTLAAFVLTTPTRRPLSGTPAALSLGYSDVSFPARGGDVSIAGWYIPREGSRQALVLVHGKDGNRTAEFAGHFLDFAAALHDRGFAVLMIDMRGHGQSGDARFGFGRTERRDIEGAVDWLKLQGFRPGAIGVLGVSLGAASSIGATADDADIGALVADCSYAAIYPVIQREWGSVSHLPAIFLPSTALIGQLALGIDIRAARPVDEIGRISPRPVLLIHGADDRLIPADDARQLQAADPTAALWVVPGAGHAGSYGVNTAAYVDRVAAFFQQSLK